MNLAVKTALCLLAAVGALSGVKGAEVVRPVNPTWEVVVADDVELLLGSALVDVPVEVDDFHGGVFSFM